MKDSSHYQTQLVWTVIFDSEKKKWKQEENAMKITVFPFAKAIVMRRGRVEYSYTYVAA